MPLPEREVPGERQGGRWSDREDSAFATFAAADGDQAVGQIEVASLKCDDLARSDDAFNSGSIFLGMALILPDSEKRGIKPGALQPDRHGCCHASTPAHANAHHASNGVGAPRHHYSMILDPTAALALALGLTATGTASRS